MLGSVELQGRCHAIAKLTNGRYAVGHLYPGQKVAANEQFDCLDAAFDYWYMALQPQPDIKTA